jgi:hypothetical protein
MGSALPQTTIELDGWLLGMTIQTLNFKFRIFNFELPLGHV